MAMARHCNGFNGNGNGNGFNGTECKKLKIPFGKVRQGSENEILKFSDA